jgi:hypothetical protein
LFNKTHEQNAAAADGPRAAVLRALGAYWKSLEGIGFSVALEKDLALSLAVRAKVSELPPSAQRLLAAAALPSELWQRLPEGALLTIAGRMDIPALVETLGEFLTEDARKSFRAVVEGTVEAILGKDAVKNLLPSLGPDWGLCVVTPPVGDKAWLPQILAALHISTKAVRISADQAVWEAVSALATLAVFHHNRGQPGQLSLKSAFQDSIAVKYLVNDEQFPPGLQPAFALKGGYLVLASSPEAICRFRATPSRETLSGEVPLMKLSLRSWYQYLTERRESLLVYAADRNHISKEEASQCLDHLLSVLQLFDRVELSQRSRQGLVTLILRVQTSKPLK